MVATTSEGEPATLSFKNNFWNAEVGNFSGFETLVKRTKDGRVICKEYLDFLRQRCIIEEQYGKALHKLGKIQWGGDEMGGVRKIWDSLRSNTEAIGLAHIQASSQLETEVGRLAETVDNNRDKRRWTEENVRTLQTQIKAAFKRMQDLRKLYESRCRDEVQASHAYHQEVARGGIESGAAEKAAARHSKVRSSMESAETAYRGSVDYLEEVRERWEKQTEMAADTFQDLETVRLTLLRDSVWKLSNILSSTCVADDEAYEDTRKVLEATDLDEGIQLFISQHQTGDKKPGSLEPEALPNSSTVGMGHAKQYESGSLGRARNYSSMGHLTDAGRSRSDLGFNSPQIPPVRPRKPPRLHTYELPSTAKQVNVNNNNNNSLHSSYNKIPTINMSPAPTRSPHKDVAQKLPPTASRRAVSRERHTIPICVENREYYRLPGVGRPPPPKQFQNEHSPKSTDGGAGNPGKSEYAESAGLAYPEPGGGVFPPKASYSSDYSDTSLDSGKFSSASTPPTPSLHHPHRYFPPTSPAPAARHRRSSSPRGYVRPPPPLGLQQQHPLGLQQPSGLQQLPLHQQQQQLPPQHQQLQPQHQQLQPQHQQLQPQHQQQQQLQQQGYPPLSGLKRARVLCEYKQKGSTEMTCSRNELVWVLEEGGEWWRVRSELGRSGFFPASFLRVVDSPT